MRLLLYLVPSVSSAVVLLVVIKSELLDLLLSGGIALRKIDCTRCVEETIQVVRRVRLQIGSRQRINILKIVRVFRN